MRHATGTLADLTTALNEAITELAAPIGLADGSLSSATSQLNLLLVWRGSALAPADGTLSGDTATYNLFVDDEAKPMKAFGEQSPTLGEDPVSWQTWSDGAGGIPNVVGDADWGKLSLQLAGAEGRSAVYDLGSAATRKFTLTENRYGTGAEDATLQIRGDTSSFAQDDISPAWIEYTSTISRSWRYVQIREVTDIRYGLWLQTSDYNTKTKCDSVITFCDDGNRITDLYPLIQNSSVDPHSFTGDSTLANITADRCDGLYPLTYLIQEAAKIGVRVHAWFCIYPTGYWFGADACLLTPLDEAYRDTTGGGNTLDFSEAVARDTVEDAISDFVTENPGLYGVSLDYIRTDGLVTDITDADVTAFVSELRSMIPSVELSFCSLSLSLPNTANYHQDGATWLANNYVDTMLSMAYNFALWNKSAYWSTCDLTGKRLMIGVDSMTIYSTDSDVRARLILQRDAGYTSFCLFDFNDNWDDHSTTLDSFRNGTISTTQGDVTKIVNTPGTSFVITIGGVDYTTLTADIAGLTTDGEVKAYVEGVEGERSDIHYRVSVNAIMKIEVGDWAE